MFTICKEFRFEASHQLTKMPEGHPCGRLHGHSYRVEIMLQSTKLDPYGFVVDYGELTAHFSKYIAENLDHRHLNDILEDPTAELIARHLFQVAVDFWGDMVEAVRVSETAKTWAEYRMSY